MSMQFVKLAAAATLGESWLLVRPALEADSTFRAQETRLLCNVIVYNALMNVVACLHLILQGSVAKWLYVHVMLSLMSL